MWSWDKVDYENENIRKVTDMYERLQHMTHDSTQCGHRRKFIVVPMETFANKETKRQTFCGRVCQWPALCAEG